MTEQDEVVLWNSGIFNTDTADGLLKAVYFYNMKVFGFRAVDEHEHLMQEQYEFGTADGLEYLRYYGRVSKGVTGSLDCRATPKVSTQFSYTSNPRCVVKIFRTYLNSLPDKGRFYRRPLPNRNNQVHFSKQVVGKNRGNGCCWN